MKDIVDFFTGLLDTSLWPARWNCGQWSDFHGWLYIFSDLAIWFSYFAIPVIILGYTARKKYELKYTSTYILFASFILLCGSTHLLDAAMFWTPMYRFNALVRFLTGVVSLFTVYHLIQILPDAFRQKTSLVLEREIARRREAEAKLAEANDDLKTFAYMASHDLQEPLRKVNIFISNLKESTDDSVSPKAREWINKSLSATGRMQQMITDILSLSGVEQNIEFEPTSLNDVLSESLDALDVKIQEKQAEIKVEELPHVSGNKAYLVQVFVNLLSNAIKFSTERPVIRVFGKTEGERVTVSVEDNGIGMRPEDTHRVFRPFERLNSKGQFQGSGIGLAICKKIIEVHGGRIEALSSPGKGTTFIIDLPNHVPPA